MDIMLLYEQSGDTINVYNFNTNGKKVIDFKKKELEKIPKEERVITFTKEVDSSYIFHEAVKKIRYLCLHGKGRKTTYECFGNI